MAGSGFLKAVVNLSLASATVGGECTARQGCMDAAVTFRKQIRLRLPAAKAARDGTDA